MEQFKIKIVKPAPDHECIMKFTQYFALLAGAVEYADCISAEG